MPGKPNATTPAERRRLILAAVRALASGEVAGYGEVARRAGLHADELDTLADKLVQISVGDASGASPQTVTIQAKDIQGNNLAEVIYVEVAVFDDADGTTPAVNATIADGGAGAVVRAVTANKDLICKTDGTGLLEIAVTDGTAETVYLLVKATFRSRIMD